jgi:N-acetylmuramoyl-L-alanine amidase CwlA
MSISNHVIKDGITIGSAKVISNDLRGKGSAIPGRVLNSIGYITLHNTGLVDVKANNFHRSLKTQNSKSNGTKASWTFAVDDIEIYQETKINWETWHAGNSTGNKNSISIEMCMWSNKEKQRKTYENAAALTAKLLKHYNLSIDKVVQHNKWSGKNCPQYLREKKHGYDWNYFISRVKAHLNNSQSSNSQSSDSKPSNQNPSSLTEKRIVGSIECLCDSLNIRKDATTNSSVVSSLKKGQKVEVMAIKDGFYKIKEDQWCSANEKYVKYTELKANVYEITADSLNIRKGRGTEHAIVGSLKKGDKIAIWSIAKDSKGNDWASFRYSFSPDVTGFVHMGYVKKV